MGLFSSRMSIELLAWYIDRHIKVNPDITIGQLASLYEQSSVRILDAIDVLKIRNGDPTQVPPVIWEDQKPEAVL